MVLPRVRRPGVPWCIDVAWSPRKSCPTCFLLSQFQFNTNLGAYSLCWVTGKHTVNVLFEAKSILKNSSHPPVRAAETLCRVMLSPTFSLHAKFSKAALPCALPSATPVDSTVAVRGPGGSGSHQRGSCVQSQDTRG